MNEFDMKDPVEKMELCEPNLSPGAAQAQGKGALNVQAPQIGTALPAQVPKLMAKPAKLVPPTSAMLTSSSQRDTQTRLLSSSVLRGSQEKDEYLLRLLGKGSKPPLPSAAASPSNGFRVPDPVPHRAAQASNRPFPGSAVELGGTAGMEKGSNPAAGQTTTASGQPTSEVAPGWSYSETQRRVGTDAAGNLRATVIAHQVTFLEQLYDLHRAIAVQKLLVRNCPEVKHLMDEAARILVSSSSGQKDQIAIAANAVAAANAAAPQAKRPRLDNDGVTTAAKFAPLPATAAVPPIAAVLATAPSAAAAAAAAALALGEPVEPMGDDGEPGLRPDSQFAAVPLPGETAATGDGSGDDGDGSGPNGSGGNGSGGGSNSPQPQLLPVQLLPPRRLLPLQGAPSEASQAPMMFPRANFMAPPWIQPMMPMPMQQMQMPPGMYPGDLLGGAGAMPSPQYHQQYANLAQMQMAAAAVAQMGGGGGGNGPGGLTTGAQQMASVPQATGPAVVPGAPATATGAPVAAAALGSLPLLVANPVVPASGASGQPSSRPSLPSAVPQAPPSGIAPSPAAQVAAAGGDPMAWWAQHYYGRQQQQQAMQMQMQMAAQMGPPQNAQQAQQMATAAAVAAFGNHGNGAAHRWWQDPTATFGPPVDLNVVAAGLATRKAGNAAGEAESAPPSSAAAAAAATATAVATAGGTNKQKGSQLVAPASARPRRSKRKPSDPIEEASSGTTGQDHHLGPHAVTDDAHFKSRSPHGSRGVAPAHGAAAAAAAAAAAVAGGVLGKADTSAAKLLLSFSNKGHVA